MENIKIQIIKFPVRPYGSHWRNSNPPEILWLRWHYGFIKLSVFLVLADFGDNTMFRICPCFTMTLLSKHQPFVREIHQCCYKTSFGNNSAVKWGFTAKQPTLECLIWVLRLPCWGFMFGYLVSLLLTLQKQIYYSISQHKNTGYINQTKAGEHKPMVTVCSVRMWWQYGVLLIVSTTQRCSWITF